MINIDNIGDLMKINNDNNIRVSDMNKNHLLDFHGETPEECWESFKQSAPMLASYKRLIVKTGDDKRVSGNWTNATTYYGAYFPDDYYNKKEAQQTQNIGLIPGGHHQDLFDVKLKLEKLLLQNDFDKKLREIEEKSKSKDDTFFKYLPFFSKYLGMSKEDLLNGMQTSYFMQHPDKMLAGGPVPAPGAKIEGTNEEKVKLLEVLMEDACNKHTIDLMIKLLQGIQEKPDLVQMALKFI